MARVAFSVCVGSSDSGAVR
nr:hypothetical protein [Vibrio antiquarius]